uniref:polyprenol monophosphomannose synthase n=1 Tax=Flavobacterium sp. TaxID=239 RepID=UPI00404B4C92
MPSSLVIIPTYNEIENIQSIIEVVLSLPSSFDVLVVDDNSPDGTSEAVRAVQNKFPNRLFLETRSGKMGLGRAYVHGFEWALNHQYDLIFEMDADFSHNPNDLELLRNACVYQNADMAIGSRYVRGVNVVNWPLSRVLMSYFASVYVQFITGMKINDATAGFVCYKKEVLEKIGIHNIEFVGYAFQIETKYRAFCKQFNLIEIPIIFTDRTKGVSKMSNAIISEAIFGVIKLRIKHLFNKI